MAELELKHSRAHAQMLKATIANLRADLWKKNEKTLKPEAFFNKIMAPIFQENSYEDDV